MLFVAALCCHWFLHFHRHHWSVHCVIEGYFFTSLTPLTNNFIKFPFILHFFFFLFHFFHCRFGASLIVKGEITFVQMMTAVLSLMLGALGLGQALNELGIVCCTDQKKNNISCLMWTRFGRIERNRTCLFDPWNWNQCCIPFSAQSCISFHNILQHPVMEHCIVFFLNYSVESIKRSYCAVASVPMIWCKWSRVGAADLTMTVNKLKTTSHPKHPFEYNLIWDILLSTRNPFLTLLMPFVRFPHHIKTQFLSNFLL